MKIKLSSYLSFRLLGVMLTVLFIWSAVYFFVQMREIHAGIDEGLENLKQEFIRKAGTNPNFIEDMEKYRPLNIIVKEVDFYDAKDEAERYITTKVYFETEVEEEEVRMLESYFFCSLNGKYYSLKIFTSTVESDDLIKNMLYTLIALWLGLAIVLMIWGRIYINKATKPFYSVLDYLEKFQLGKSGEIDMPETSIKEFAQLNKTVKKMLRSSTEIYNEQKNFVENAAHELQTPLAITISRLELLMNEPGTTDIQIKEIHKILQTLNRMKRLNANLLLLTKISNRQYWKTDSVDLTALFEQVLGDFSDFAEHKNIHLSIVRKATITVEMNSDLAYILATNLIKNAVIHNINGGRLDMVFTENTIVMSNSGLNKPLSDKMFSRYKTGEDKMDSSGLGLSIVQSIVELYNFSISYSYQENLHTFTLRL